VQSSHALVVLDVGINHIEVLIAQEFDLRKHVFVCKVDEESLALVISDVINLILEVLKEFMLELFSIVLVQLQKISEVLELVLQVFLHGYVGLWLVLLYGVQDHLLFGVHLLLHVVRDSKLLLELLAKYLQQLSSSSFVHKSCKTYQGQDQ
jgi:hypothetical protein